MRINFRFATLLLFIQLITLSLLAQDKINENEQLYRPSMHFTPAKGWMNDPNGMFYKDGIYHLYFQHYPDSTVWGPMHWGHATSTDLIHWKHEPIAIYPDNIGMIFSGSAVVDENNTSGFGVNGKAPIVAIFTQHNMEGEKSGKIDFQNQSIAYSNDNGYTWKMYAGNPVIHNPGIKDFRDPKVMWHEASKKWIMTLAVKNKVSFYSSSNLKEWKHESDFGINYGSHDGVWECPDLFSLKLNNQAYWVLTASINPGGPNKGSATQYFIGSFDGHNFITESSKIKWMDYGADNYAGVTFSNTGDQKISIGWMSNWMYAQQVPTMQWRSALTSPRELNLFEVNGEKYLGSVLFTKPEIKNIVLFNDGVNKLDQTTLATPFKFSLAQEGLKSFCISLSNDIGEHLDFGYDSATNQYFIDRSNAGVHNFHSQFAQRHTAPRLFDGRNVGLGAIIDKTSIELFGDIDCTIITDIFFPTKPYTKIKLESKTDKSKMSYRIVNYLTP